MHLLQSLLILTHSLISGLLVHVCKLLKKLELASTSVFNWKKRPKPELSSICSGLYTLKTAKPFQNTCAI
jgi:hypothetical protein